MKRKAQLNIGDRIQIVRKRRNRSIMYASQVLDIVDEDTYVISGPITVGKLVQIFINELVEIIYIIEDKGRYKFEAIVLSSKEKGIYQLTIKKISSTSKIQQRNYFRLKIDIPVKKYFVLKNNQKYKMIKEKTLAKDLSGNGMNLLCNYRHDVHDIIDCVFEIDNRKIHTGGKIIRIEEVDHPSFKYALGICFYDIKKDDREYIIKFIFKQERIINKRIDSND